MSAARRHLIPPLLRVQGFRRYWGAQTISMFGDQISSIVLPLVGVLTLHAGAAQMGYLAGLEWLPSLLFGMHAGAWVDRFGHRRALMITADLGRAAVLASVPACYAAGVLTLAQLYGVALAAGTLSVLFNVCDPALFVALVPSDRYVEGNSLVYASRALSFVGGPSAGGVLAQLLTAPFAVMADALSFVGSAFFLSRVRVPSHRPPPRPIARCWRARVIYGARRWCGPRWPRARRSTSSTSCSPRCSSCTPSVTCTSIPASWVSCWAAGRSAGCSAPH